MLRRNGSGSETIGLRKGSSGFDNRISCSTCRWWYSPYCLSCITIGWTLILLVLLRGYAILYTNYKRRSSLVIILVKTFRSVKIKLFQLTNQMWYRNKFYTNGPLLTSCMECISLWLKILSNQVLDRSPYFIIKVSTVYIIFHHGERAVPWLRGYTATTIQ